MKKKKLWLALILLVIIAGLATGAFLYFKNNNDEGEKITIKFDANGGEEVKSIKIEKGSKLEELPTTIRDGYNFKGWYDKDDNKVEDNTKFKKSTTLHAEWEAIPEDAKTMKLEFDTKGGSKIESITMECEKPLTLPDAPTKEGYKFVRWEDKDGKKVEKDNVLACEDTTLYAKWEKVEEKKPDPKPADPEPTPEPVKEKTYKCPEGYELVDTSKCVSKKNPEYYCKDGYTNSTVDNTVCYQYVKEPDKVSCKNNGYYYQENGHHFCGYEELASYTGSRERCQANGGTYVQSNSHCFKRISEGSSNLEYTCYSSVYRTAAQLGSNKSGCYNLTQRDYGCKNAGEGYTMNHTYGKCVKTIDATLE